jgi:hypothetical protein
MGHFSGWVGGFAPWCLCVKKLRRTGGTVSSVVWVAAIRLDMISVYLRDLRFSCFGRLGTETGERRAYNPPVISKSIGT